MSPLGWLGIAAVCAVALAGIFSGALLNERDDPRACYRFTREVKIVQACQAANSCVFSPADLRRVDELQESCQRLGK